MADPLVFLSGTNLDGPVSTDQQLAAALAVLRPLLWVDPPVAVQRLARRARPTAPTPDLRQVRTWGPPLLTRAPLRSAAEVLYALQAGSAVRRTGPAGVQLLSNALHDFVSWPGRRVLFLTDDWVAGADLMGLDTEHVRRHLRRNLVRSDLVVGVTRYLLDSCLGEYDIDRPTLVLPNGCDPELYSSPETRSDRVPNRPYAVLIGQLNERLDLDLLTALVDHGVPLVIAGSNRGRSEVFTRQLEGLLERSMVTVLGHIDRTELAGVVQHAALGLVPYRRDAFNLASAPLKTWDYLAAGVPAVSTDLPASRAINSRFVTCASDPAEFVAAVLARLGEDPAPAASERQALARSYSWDSAARLLLSTIDDL